MELIQGPNGPRGLAHHCAVLSHCDECSAVQHVCHATRFRIKRKETKETTRIMSLRCSYLIFGAWMALQRHLLVVSDVQQGSMMEFKKQSTRLCLIRTQYCWAYPSMHLRNYDDAVAVVDDHSQWCKRRSQSYKPWRWCRSTRESGLASVLLQVPYAFKFGSTGGTSISDDW